jgi:toxin FitB
VSYLVDTNVFSELTKLQPNPKVISWLRAHEPELYVSTVTIGELRRGIERLEDGTRKTRLREWLSSVCSRMPGRILSFNTATAHVWGQLKAKWELQGVIIPSLDSQIAATAQRHQLTVVTRNTADFSRSGVRMLNPFSDNFAL